MNRREIKTLGGEGAAVTDGRPKRGGGLIWVIQFFILHLTNIQEIIYQHSPANWITQIECHHQVWE